eukprot:6666235-Prymnesium_polylepis.1
MRFDAARCGSVRFDAVPRERSNTKPRVRVRDGRKTDEKLRWSTKPGPNDNSSFRASHVRYRQRQSPFPQPQLVL